MPLEDVVANIHCLGGAAQCRSSCFVLLSLLARLGCTERSARLARTTITSENSKECKRCGGALDIQSPGRPRGLLPVMAMECQLFV